MIKILQIIILFFSIHSIAIGQTNELEWNDSTFQIGQKRSIKLYFASDGPCTMRPCYNYADNAAVIDTLITFLKKHPNLEIEIGSHQDLRGGVSYNQQLSEIHAEGTKNELILHGIEKERMTYKGYGESKPIIPFYEIKKIKGKENRDKVHRINNRIEITITKI